MNKKYQEQKIEYMIQLKEDFETQDMPTHLRNITDIYPRFSAILVNYTSIHLYFNFKNVPSSLIIIPYSWVKWMLPLKVKETT